MVDTRTYDLDRVFHALADPTRRAILKDLTRRERAITEVARPFRISLAAVSKHVKVLELAKLVERRRHGSFSYLRLNGDAMRTADEWLQHYKQFWEQRLDALEEFLKKKEAP